ncbi:MAG: hypothetical protein R3246_00005, partial [Acidimicrobiia bacterium]|nr:hypothetical protein [Acidimicrobiia bacterium]
LVFSYLTSPLGIICLIGALLVFPDGQLRSSLWRWAAAGLVVFALDGLGKAMEVVGYDVPVLSQLEALWFPIGMVFTLAALVSLVLRALTGTGVVRRQIGWFASGVAVYVGFLLVASGFFDFAVDGSGPYWVAIDQVFFSAIPVSIWIAISRYRLYDLDRLISRTVAYAAVVAVLAATYLAALATVSSVLPVDDEIGVAVSTLAVVAMFAPVRRRVLAAVDRRFFRTRYQAQEVFDGFARRLRARPVVGTEEISEDVIDVLERTLAPERAAVWVRTS